MPESAVDISPVAVRPDLTPDRKPQALSPRLSERVRQITLIAKSPTEDQVLSVARKLLTEGVTPAVAKAEARNTFGNFSTLLEEQKAAEQEVAQARAEALRSSQADFIAKKEALNAAIGRRSQARQTVRTTADWFRDTGIQVDPSQRPLTGGEVSSKRMAEAGYTVAQKASEAQAAVGQKVEQGRQAWARGVEAGRGALRSGVEAGRNGVTNAAEGTRAAFDLAWNAAKNTTEAVSGKLSAGAVKLEAGAQSRGRAAFDAVSQRVRGVWRGGKEAVESAEQRVAQTWEAGTIWLQTASETVAKTTFGVVGAVGNRIDAWMSFAGESVSSYVGKRTEAFNTKMQEMGKAARESWGNASEGVVSFVKQQEQRVLAVEQKVVSRISTSVNQAIEKGKIALSPAWEAVGRERQSMRESRSVVFDKLGIVATQVSEVAHPFVDPIIDKGRDIRDAAMGFGKAGIRGIGAVGRSIGSTTVETGNAMLKSLHERFADLRVRANESRNRLNLFIGEVAGGTGARFKSLKESAEAVLARGKNFISGVEVAGGKVMLKGQEAAEGVHEWFSNHAAAAAETLKNAREATQKGMEALGRYWELYAVGKWNEMGLNSADVSDRLKLMRALTAASVKRAATISAASGLEGAELVSRFVRTPQGKLAIGVAALAFGIASHPQEIQHLIEGIQNGLQNGGSDLSSIGSFFTSGEVHANVGTPDVNVSMPSASPDIGTVAAPDVVATTPPIQEIASQEIVTVPPDILDAVAHGQPVEPQALRLAQEVSGVNPTEAFFGIMKNTLFGNLDNFRSTAQAIVNGPGYSSLEKAVAQNQLNAIKILESNPNIDPGNVDNLALLRQAVHYWRP